MSSSGAASISSILTLAPSANSSSSCCSPVVVVSPSFPWGPQSGFLSASSRVGMARRHPLLRPWPRPRPAEAPRPWLRPRPRPRAGFRPPVLGCWACASRSCSSSSSSASESPLSLGSSSSSMRKSLSASLKQIIFRGYQFDELRIGRCRSHTPVIRSGSDRSPGNPLLPRCPSFRGLGVSGRSLGWLSKGTE